MNNVKFVCLDNLIEICASLSGGGTLFFLYLKTILEMFNIVHIRKKQIMSRIIKFSARKMFAFACRENEQGKG